MLEKHKHDHAVHNFDGIIENRVTTPPLYFSILFYGLIIWGVLFIAYFLLSGWSSTGEFEENMAAHTAAYSSGDATTPATTSVATGSIDAAALFAANCAGCHGADGKGGFGSDLSSPAYKYGRSQDAVRSSIAEGRGGRMPGFSGQLSAAEIDALTEFSLSL